MSTHLQPRDRAQHRAGLGAHALRVPEVAGVVVGHAGADRVPRGARSVGEQVGEHLVDVADRRAERRGPLGPLGVVGEQVAVLLHRRPAARDVGDDVRPRRAARTGRSSSGRGPARRPRDRRAAPARRSTAGPRGTMTSQPSAASTRAVAALTRWKNTSWTQPVSSATVARRVPGRGDALGQPGEGVAQRDRRQQRLQRAEPCPAAVRGERAGPRAGPRSFWYSAPGHARPPAAAACRGTARRSLRGTAGPPGRAATLRSSCGRTASSSWSYCTPDGHAVTQAMQPRHAVDVLVQRPSSADLALLREVHQVDPPARGVHLLAPQLVGRAGWQAEAAVHAVVEQLALRAVVVVEGAGPRLREVRLGRAGRSWWS